MGNTDSLATGNRVVHGLWIGTRLSVIELLTIKSFLEQGHTFCLWHYDEILTELPHGVTLAPAEQIIPREEVFSYKESNQFGHGKGSYAGFSDLFRYKLLYEKGGWWVDMDVTCLKPLDFDEPYVFRSHRALPVVGNLLKCPPHSELMKSCYEQALTSVDASNKDWFRPIKILNDNIGKLGLSNYIRSGIIHYDEWGIVNALCKYDLKVPTRYVAIHWMNEEWRSRNISKDQIVKNSTLNKLLVKHGFADYQVLSSPPLGSRKTLLEKNVARISLKSYTAYRVVQFILNVLYWFYVKIMRAVRRIRIILGMSYRDPY